MNRRRFLQSTAAISAGFVGLRQLVHGPTQASAQSAESLPVAEGFGPLVKDPDGVFDLPEGFTYKVISKAGEKMDDGLFVPSLHDGMAAFLGEGGKTILVRNHECDYAPARRGAFGWKRELMHLVPREKFYDAGYGVTPALGGTTTVVYDTRTQRVEKHFLSLAGTVRNCAGGPTPWNSWITCEETVQTVNDHCEKEHGYAFEVPASADSGLADPVPLKAMGRFRHEAVAVDPHTHIVYQTEDIDEGLIYRFIPNERGKLHKGGKLQALAIVEQPSRDTRNWRKDDYDDGAADAPIPLGDVMDVRWIDMDDPESPNDDLRKVGFNNGAAKFARGEGMFYGHQSIFFVCTTGGQARFGQVWRYVPSRFEGTPDEERFPGRLELFVEPNDGQLINMADNITVSPWGDLLLCEDGGGTDRLCGVTPEGKIYHFGFNRMSNDELAGICFSPDGSTAFVNIQGAGITLAITGPWDRGRTLVDVRKSSSSNP